MTSSMTPSSIRGCRAEGVFMATSGNGAGGALSTAWDGRTLDSEAAAQRTGARMARRKDQKSRRMPVIHRRIISYLLIRIWNQVID
jgi:hypothetical protein